MEPGTTAQLSDLIEFLGDIIGTITSDTETTPERAGPTRPITVLPNPINLANDTWRTNFGQKFSLTEAGEENGQSIVTVNVPGVHLSIPGDDVDIKPFTFMFTSFNTEPEGGMEETFKGPVFRIVFESDAVGIEQHRALFTHGANKFASHGGAGTRISEEASYLPSKSHPQPITAVSYDEEGPCTLVRAYAPDCNLLYVNELTK
jgi:hypothetical protein